jgi:hypothetical protein
MYFLSKTGCSRVRFFPAAVVCAAVALAGCSDESTGVKPAPVEDADVVSIERRVWYPASPPVDPDGGVAVLPCSLRAPAYWYNIEPPLGARRRDFNPNLDERDNTPVTTVDIELAPVLSQPSGRPWTGIMTGFRRPVDLSGRRYLEIWVNDFKPTPHDRGGVLYVDVGRIDENFFEPEDQRWNDEDRDRDGFNACIDDSGLDETHNFLPDCVRNIYPDDPTEGGYDPYDDLAGDDYVPNRIDGLFSKINGTEQNGYYDTEDLDGSGALDRANSYFRYAIDLADGAVLDVRSEYPAYDGFLDPHHARDSWRWYRVELFGGTPVGDDWLPDPDLTRVHHVRVWFRDAGEVVHDEDTVGRRRLQCARVKFTGHPLPAE